MLGGQTNLIPVDRSVVMSLAVHSGHLALLIPHLEDDDLVDAPVLLVLLETLFKEEKNKFSIYAYSIQKFKLTYPERLRLLIFVFGDPVTR